MRFCSATLGCKVNQYETGAIESLLCGRGHEMVKSGEGCEVCIINTCAVTSEGVRKSRQTIRRMKKLEPGALIAVYGCFSQLEPEAAEQLGADLIGGTSDRKEFAILVEELILERSPHRLAPLFRANHKFEALPPGKSSDRTRALLKIQDGCDNFCTYCVVPHARGRSRSLPPDLVAEYAGKLQEQGYKEIVITGIEISSYEPSLDEAIRIIHAAAPHVRLRLGSIDPVIVTDEFCAMLSVIPNICDHFHLSLQSGCDEILRAMGRKYSAAQVLEAIHALRNRFPDCAITADLICGFPGETDEQFEQTMKLIKEASFSNMHIFPFSARTGTTAAKMSGQINKSIKRERVHIAAKTAALMANRFRHSQIGKTVEVLFEQCNNGLCIGHSCNYLKVAVKCMVERNSLHKVIITGIEDDLLLGRTEGEC